MSQRTSRSSKKAAPSRKRDAAARKARSARAPEQQGSAGTSSDGVKPSSANPQPQGVERQKLDPQHFPVVALGASLGGLAALEKFFSGAPKNPGMAFVVITHQAPDHASLLPQLIARHVELPVTNIEDGTVLAPNHVYITPAGTSLLLQGGRLQLLPTDHRNTSALPIDASFRSLAQAYGERVIAVVLSGNGSDGRSVCSM